MGVLFAWAQIAAANRTKSYDFLQVKVFVTRTLTTERGPETSCRSQYGRAIAPELNRRTTGGIASPLAYAKVVPWYQPKLDFPRPSRYDAMQACHTCRADCFFGGGGIYPRWRKTAYLPGWVYVGWPPRASFVEAEQCPFCSPGGKQPWKATHRTSDRQKTEKLNSTPEL